MRVLITGGAGYIGSHVVRAHMERGDDVVVLDRLMPGHPAAVRGAELVVGDVTDRTLVRRVLHDHRIAGIVHLAGEKSVEESLREPGRYFETNVTGSLVLMACAVEAGIRAFVFSSTCAVYGIPDQLPVVESSAVHPETPYGLSKLMVEQILGWFDRAHGLRSASLRYFNAAGAAFDGETGEEWHHATTLVPVVMKAALGKIPSVEVFGNDYPTPDGTAIRDYIHVVDLAEAHLAALDYLASGGASLVVNLGTGSGSSIREVIAATELVSHTQINVRYGPRRPGDAPAVWADSTAAKHLFGWRAQLGLEDIVRDAYLWHSKHPEGYGPRD